MAPALKTLHTINRLMNVFFIVNIIQPPVSVCKSLSRDHPKLPKVLLIVFDGFRHDFLALHGPLPNLDAMRRQGVLVPSVTPVYPTTTFPNLMSMVTGLYPCVHGAVSNILFDRKLRRQIHFWDANVTDGARFFEEREHVLPLWVGSYSETKFHCLYYYTGEIIVYKCTHEKQIELKGELCAIR
jgi:predicted AlkP superfamily pyrophosphatase or phosphodiesterase